MAGGKPTSGKPIRTSIRVLGANRRLLLLPLLSGTGTVLVAGALLIPLGILTRFSPSPGLYAALALGYLALACVTTLVTSALVGAVDDAMRGEPVAVRASYVRALRMFRRLLPWAVLNATVVPLASLLQGIPGAGWALSALLGDGWMLATYLALPAMVIDGLGIRDALRRSLRIFRRRGAVQIRSSILLLLMGVPLLLVVLPAVILGVESDSRTAAVGALAGAGLVMVAATVLNSTVQGIVRTVLYREGAAALPL